MLRLRIQALLHMLSKLVQHFNSSTMANETYTIDLNTLQDFNFTKYDVHNFMYNNDSSLQPEDDCRECSLVVQDAVRKYGEIHGYLSLIVCMFGTVANILNIAVLTRKDMACAPINRILTGLAVADMLVMLEYIPFVCYYYLYHPNKMDFPYSWAVFILFHVHFTQVLHTISICLTLALAVWRYIAIRYPERNHILCSDSRCTLAISVSYLLPILLCSPSYLVFEIHATTIVEDNVNFILYHTQLSEIARREKNFLYGFNFWMYAVVIKLLPCCILTVISFWLIEALWRTKKRKQVLRSYNVCPQQSTEHRKVTKSERRADRTTRMLVAVLILFLVTEFPQGILGLLSGLLGECFFLKCYQKFGDLMDILALLNGAINFILYCCMSRQFRMTFGQLFKPSIFKKVPPIQQTEIQTTTCVNGTTNTTIV